MSTFENILENLKKKYQQEYGVAVFDIEAKNTKSGIMIKGKVLTENQRDEVLEELKKNIKKDTRYKIQGYKIKENIKVLSDASKRNEIGWAIVKEKIIDLKSRFVSDKIINDKILNRIRCSQALKGEVLRVLYKHKNQFLVQQNDLTLGWVDKSKIIFNPIKGARKKHPIDKGGRGVSGQCNMDLYKEWRKGNYAIKGKTVFAKRLQINTPLAPLKRGIGTVESADKPANRIIEEAEKYLGAPYLLGGKSKNGIDCSGLVQIAYKNSLGIILPKHSWDQKEMGIKIKLENIKTGDLIFLIKKSNKHKHVGIAEVIIDKNPPTPPFGYRSGQALIKGAYKFNPAYQGRVNLIHASLNKKKVLRQKLEEVFKSHDFAEARRIISL